MQVQIKFTATGCNMMTGNFAPGDLMRTTAEFARHLVEEAKCAAYVERPQVEAPQQSKPKRSK